MKISTDAMSRYSSIARNMMPRIGGGRLVSAVTQEDLLFIRKELLTGYRVSKTGQKTLAKGRSIRTVSNYVRTTSGTFNFTADSGYVKANPFNDIPIFKRSRAESDPLTREEFAGLIDTYTHQQLRNIQSLAMYTEVRHGGLVSIAWEDIDLKAGTMIIRRSHTLTEESTLPRTGAGTDRIINLIQPAIDVSKNQAEITKLGKQYQVEVKLREYGRTDVSPFTFVFNPQIVSRSSHAGHRYAVGSINQSWEVAVRRTGIHYHRAYQSKHIYACWSLAAGTALTSSRSKRTAPTRRWFTGYTNPGWQRTARTKYSCSTRN